MGAPSAVTSMSDIRNEFYNPTFNKPSQPICYCFSAGGRYGVQTHKVPHVQLRCFCASRRELFRPSQGHLRNLSSSHHRRGEYLFKQGSVKRPYYSSLHTHVQLRCLLLPVKNSSVLFLSLTD